jgi:hypothetical protein
MTEYCHNQGLQLIVCLIIAGLPCHSKTELPCHSKNAVKDYRERLPGKSAGQAGQVCRASLPGMSAGQVCRASLLGMSDQNL